MLAWKLLQQELMPIKLTASREDSRTRSVKDFAMYVIALVALILFSFSHAFAQTRGSASPLLVGRVAINQHQIAFTYAGKIWLVERSGGEARPLDNSPNEETNPVFSPDGKQIAFSRSNKNDFDIYVAAADGNSESRRLTYQRRCLECRPGTGREQCWRTTGRLSDTLWFRNSFVRKPSQPPSVFRSAPTRSTPGVSPPSSVCRA